MEYPRVVIDLNKIKHNVRTLVNICRKQEIDVMGVTKVFCGNKEISRAIAESGVKYIADSRIENLAKNKDISLEKVLLRLPMISQLCEVVKYSDISLNSELDTILKLNEEAKRQKKIHKVILMIDLGDLREGIYFEENYLDLAQKIVGMDNIELFGIGTNLTCYGGIIPRENHIQQLELIKNEIETKCECVLKIISAGNSSSLHLVNTDISNKINNLRLGESIVLGRETAFGKKIPDTYDDVFLLEAEIIESSSKPSYPIGEIGMDAFGNIPKFIDKGKINRIIVAIGRQDVQPCDIIPINKNMKVLGGSSDHIIIDVTACEKNYRVGDIVTFKLEYGSILSVMTSEYVAKKLI